MIWEIWIAIAVLAAWTVYLHLALCSAQKTLRQQLDKVSYPEGYAEVLWDYDSWAVAYRYYGMSKFEVVHFNNLENANRFYRCLKREG